MKTAVVVPTFNEERHILRVLEEASRHSEIIIVSDSSTDRTPEIVRESGKAILLNARKRGKGAQLGEGFSFALNKGADIIVQIDGDGERDPSDIEKMLDGLENTGSDIAVARRSIMRSMRRRLLNSFGFFWIRLVTGYRIRDPFSGMIAFRSEALRKLDLRTSGFEIEPEIMLEAWKRGLSLSEVAIKVPEISRSSFSVKEMLKTNLFFDTWIIRNSARIGLSGKIILPLCFLGMASAIPVWISRL